MTISKTKKKVKLVADDADAKLKSKGGNKKTNRNSLTSGSSSNSLADDGDDDDDYPVGTKIIVCYRDGSNRVAKVIERAKDGNGESSESSSWQYYVHYDDFNRRMDEWVDANRVISLAGNESSTDDHHEMLIDGIAGGVSSIESNENNENKDDLKSNRNKSNITTVSELEHDEHEGLDATSLLEHEEITKVKNIKYVVFGRYVYILYKCLLYFSTLNAVTCIDCF